MRSFLVLAALVSGGVLTTRVHAQDVTNLGGDLTSDLPGRHAIQLPAPNIASQARFDRHVSGFSVFHRNVTPPEGLGPRFNNPSCGGCHVNNGRGPAAFSRSLLGGSTLLVKVSLRGLNPDGSPKNVPGVGEQLQDHAVSGKRPTNIKLKWLPVRGKYPDGTRYTLRKPSLDFTVPGYNKRKLAFSQRMTPAVIGPGLLESISERTVLELSDPNDANGDGISGRPQYVPDRRTGNMALGRFGFRASHPTVEEQTAAAAFHDIGVTNALFLEEGKTPELSDDELERMVLYQAVAGVPPARNQSDPVITMGRDLFHTVGCDGCHRPTVTTGTSVNPELVGQTIHPFTDLLLHDMGRQLADKRAEFQASGSEWRTTPLWGLGFSETLSNVKALYLHDARARTVEEAILWHGGEAAGARERFKALNKGQRAALIAFLRSL